MKKQYYKLKPSFGQQRFIVGKIYPATAKINDVLISQNVKDWPKDWWEVSEKEYIYQQNLILGKIQKGQWYVRGGHDTGKYFERNGLEIQVALGYDYNICFTVEDRWKIIIKVKEERPTFTEIDIHDWIMYLNCNKCPSGNKFGYDADKKPECAACPFNIWDKCCDLQEQISINMKTTYRFKDEFCNNRYVIAANAIINMPRKIKMTDDLTDGDYVEPLRRAGVLDLWFDKVDDTVMNFGTTRVNLNLEKKTVSVKLGDEIKIESLENIKKALDWIFHVPKLFGYELTFFCESEEYKLIPLLQDCVSLGVGCHEGGLRNMLAIYRKLNGSDYTSLVPIKRSKPDAEDEDEDEDEL